MVVEAILERLCGPRSAQGRPAQKPHAAIIDSQTVKMTEMAGPRGYDVGKRGPKDENGTSWLIPWACCWCLWSTPRAFRTLLWLLAGCYVVATGSRGFSSDWKDDGNQPASAGEDLRRQNSPTGRKREAVAGSRRCLRCGGRAHARGG